MQDCKNIAPNRFRTLVCGVLSGSAQIFREEFSNKTNTRRHRLHLLRTCTIYIPKSFQTCESDNHLGEFCDPFAESRRLEKGAVLATGVPRWGRFIMSEVPL